MAVVVVGEVVGFKVATEDIKSVSSSAGSPCRVSFVSSSSMTTSVFSSGAGEGVDDATTFC